MSQRETTVVSDEEMRQIHESGHDAPYPKVHASAFGTVVKINGRWHHVDHRDLSRCGVDFMQLPVVENVPEADA